MKYRKLGMSLAVSTLLGLGLIGCGGGSSSDNSSSSGVTNTSGTNFPTNAVMSEATLENVQKVEDATATNQMSVLPTLNSVESDSKLSIPLLIKKVSFSVTKNIKNSNIENYALNETINESENCSNGGNISITGSGDESTGGTISVSYNNCIEDDIKMNGSITGTISNYDSSADDFKDYSINFNTDFTVSSTSDISFATIKKDSNYTMNILSFDEYENANKFKLKMSIIATDGTESYGMEDASFIFEEIDYSTVSMYQTEGKIYINNLTSYVDYDTSYDMSQTPFTFDSYDNILSGESRYNMSNNSKLKIIVEDNEAITYIDVDGDGTYELSEKPLV